MGTTPNKKLRGLAVALMLVMAFAVGGLAVYAAGPGLLTILSGSDGQQGSTTVTGDCQVGDLTVTFTPGAYDEAAASFLLDSLDVSGIDAACASGSIVLIEEGGASLNEPLTIVAGTATVDLASQGIQVGAVTSLALALFAAP